MEEVVFDERKASALLRDQLDAQMHQTTFVRTQWNSEEHKARMVFSQLAEAESEVKTLKYQLNSAIDRLKAHESTVHCSHFLSVGSHLALRYSKVKEKI